jgi:hypothetical protein
MPEVIELMQDKHDAYETKIKEWIAK